MIQRRQNSFVKLLEMKPGMLSQELKEALGMPEGAPPPWLTNMQLITVQFPLGSYQSKKRKNSQSHFSTAPVAATKVTFSWYYYLVVECEQQIIASTKLVMVTSLNDHQISRMCDLLLIP